VTLSDVDRLVALALACFLLAYVESMAVARTFAAKHGYEIDPNQEFLALGAANVAVGLGQGYPVGGGMSQSAVNDAGGARTPLAIAVASGFIALVLLFLTGLFRNLPEPILAAVVLVAVKGLIDVKALSRIRRGSKSEFWIALLALASVLFLGMLRGLLVGVIVSILMLIRRAAHPPTVVLGRIPGSDRFSDIAQAPENEQIQGVLVFRVDGAIFFANASAVRNELIVRVDGAERPIQLVVFDLAGSALIDLAGVQMLEELHERLAKRGILLRLAGARHPVRQMIQAAASDDRFGVLEPTTSIARAIIEWQTVSAPSAPFEGSAGQSRGEDQSTGGLGVS
jgi:MFS superfamily sulfate permease-like transporter